MKRRSIGSRRMRVRPAVRLRPPTTRLVVRKQPLPARRRPLRPGRGIRARPATVRRRSWRLRRSPRRRWRRPPRPVIRRYRWWDWGYPFLTDWGAYPIIDEGAPLSSGLSEPARRSLLQRGLLGGIWRRRLAQAGPEIIRFINRFHQVGGFERVLEDLFGDRFRRAVARMAIRLSHRLANDDPDFVQNLHFDRRLSHVLDSGPILTIVVGHRGNHYRFMPLRQLRSRALLRQLKRDMMVFGSPSRVRWTFYRHLMPSRGELITRLQRLLSSRGGPALRPWLAALARMVVTV